MNYSAPVDSRTYRQLQTLADGLRNDALAALDAKFQTALRGGVAPSANSISPSEA